jgi:hypothetical protein
MLLAFCALACSSAPDTPAAAADDKGTVVDIDGLKSKAPADWKEEKPSSNMRFLQFRLPKVEGDKEDAEVQLFRNAGGTVKDNLKRWKDQFIPPEGKQIDDVAKVSELKIGGNEATMLDIQGTWKSPQFDPKYKGARLENFRLIGVQFGVKENGYHIKLVGPAKTVEHYKKGFDEWLKAFK